MKQNNELYVDPDDMHMGIDFGSDLCKEKIIINDIEIDANRLNELAKADKDGRCVILPSRSDEIVHAIEVALRIKLYDWQKAYIFGESKYLMPGRRTGRTTAYMLNLLLSEGDPIHLYRQKILREICDEYHGPHYYEIFKSNLRDMYYKLSRPGIGLKLREIHFFKPKERNEFYEERNDENRSD